MREIEANKSRWYYYSSAKAFCSVLVGKPPMTSAGNGCILGKKRDPSAVKACQSLRVY
jgi:hypothetical protein